ncbi:ABC transporter permease [Dawidia soli]|uniref:ABC transporter permease n=1 Tax=Dawidia soli TaxID=2782352 RepID=A0AAP2GKG2_9BACT|nr:ABC transporter permease [Dawidia soli]MBT1690426.1 ABC transporter permease [Dawidia soli]
MIRNYLITAFRNFLRHRSFTFLNVTGLTLGMIASLLILQYVKYERSYDTFHSRANDIYRIQYNQWQNGKLRFECAAAVPAVGPALKNNFPEVKSFTRLFPVSGVMTYDSPERGQIAFQEEKMQIADSSVFAIFDFTLVQGDPVHSLEGPNKVVMSQRAAKKYFATEDPLGKILRMDGQEKYEVTGIFKDVPENSHIKFDFLLSYQTLDNRSHNNSQTNWGWYDFNTYVLLEPGTDVPALQAKWNNYLEHERGEGWKKDNVKQEFLLKPLLGIHLYANLLQESEPDERGNGDSVYALTFIALFILVIAWINYINLATARSLDRANEVGVRKVMGAQKQQLIYQFLAESFMLNLVATVVALAAVRAVWPFFSELSGRNIPMAFMGESDFWFLVIGLFTLGTVLSGFYPAIILSSFKPVAVLKGKIARVTHGNMLRKSLVVFQFAASVVLISVSIVVYQQLSYMRQQDLGVDIHRTLVFRAPSVTDSLHEQRTASFKTEALRVPGVTSMSGATSIPGDEIFWANSIRRLTGGSGSSISGYTVGIDHDYIPAFGLKLAAGRNFDREFTGDKKSIILNQAMTEALDFESPAAAIGQSVIQGDTFQIVGVLEDFHQMSLKEAVTPLVFRFTPEYARFYAFKVDEANYRNVLAALEKPWKEIFPGNPLEYFFLDEYFNRQYESDRLFSQTFTLFTALAIFIACLGLFGLASFMTLQRTKEIGVRKVLGSSVADVVILLSRGFVQLVLIANLLAWPLAWYIMDQWLAGFPYHISINPLLFVAAGGAVVLIAFLSVSLQTIRAARANPAKTLKYE